MIEIKPERLVPLDIFEADEPIKIELAYKEAAHKDNIFGKIYHDDARLWAYDELTLITLKAARLINDQHNLNLLIFDSLRTTDSQEAMQETEVVKAHPEWMVEPRMLAPPGHGAHPRGMAIDITLIDKHGEQLDMGTPFDGMEKDSWRNYSGFSEEILNNRKILENAMVEAAAHFGLPLLPLPNEWWDFRFPPEVYDQYKPLQDSDLPPQMQMTNPKGAKLPNLNPEHFAELKKNILSRLN